jgi:7-keto-8-aminopelargonate synthetase-like enzyme
MGKRVETVVSSPAWDSLMQRVRAAADNWVTCNAEYLRARMAFDANRIANLRTETSLYLAFAQAKAAVKDATDRYYSELSLITSMKNTVNTAKTLDKLEETLKSLFEQRKSLIDQARAQSTRLGR